MRRHRTGGRKESYGVSCVSFVQSQKSLRAGWDTGTFHRDGNVWPAFATGSMTWKSILPSAFWL